MHRDDNIKITVIIPTRDRCDVLGGTLQTVLAQDDMDIEILVCDNFSEDDTRATVEAHDDPRLRYVKTPKRLSMSHNWEFALSHVDSGWITILGDDDGLMPKAISKVRELMDLYPKIEAIRSTNCSYTWPNLIDAPYGRLKIPLHKKGCELRDCRKWQDLVLQGKETYGQLPMLYNGGFVSLQAMKRFKKDGVYYRSCIPDVYSAMGLSTTLEKYLYCHTPLAINGASKHSNGSAQFQRSSSVERTPYLKFLSEGNMPFHEDLPTASDGAYVPSLLGLVYESYIQTEFLRNQLSDADRIEMHALMLERILQQPKGRLEELLVWGQDFSEQHDLDFEKIVKSTSLYRKTIGRCNDAKSKLELLNWYAVGSREQPIPNVMDAAGFADAYLDGPLGWKANLGRLTLKALKIKK